METYKSVIAYDGTDFFGFQRQKPGLRTIQAEIEVALRNLGWEGSSLKAAGRTDAGVHARGQVISFDLNWDHDVRQLTKALNAHLPPEISVVHSEAVESGFHPRFSALRRRYRYTILSVPVRDPLRERYVWRNWPAPNAAGMNEAAQALLGEHDFAPFGRAPIPGGHTIRHVYEAQWHADGDESIFTIEADAFLYRMVRRITALLKEVGVGREEASAVVEFLNNPSLRWEGAIAPANGLCLDAVIYPETSREIEPERLEGEIQE
jgi:tRNA pseudouridine38-40 synthase